MRLLPALHWTIEGDAAPLDGRLVALLAGMEEHGSLAAASAAAGVPYRSAWGILRDASRRLSAPLVSLERGRGATLAPAGLALLRADVLARRRLADAQFAVPLAPRALQAATVRIAASHDLALAQLRDGLPATGRLRIELAFMGSLEALAAYCRGEADIAGFHLPADRLDEAAVARFHRMLQTRRDRLIGFAAREQGLILAPGNPRRVKSLRDVAAKKLRFVNRQPGSGTRLLVDAMLRRDGLAARGIAGYETEERNHVAVAAAVAAGTADAGFGLRAAAAEFGLAFVPLARERYLFAVRAAAITASGVAAFLELLRGPLTRRALRALPGYAADATGELLPVHALRP